MKVWSTVIRSIRVEVDFDDSKCEDDDYLEEKQEEIIRNASKDFGCSPKDLIIHNSDIVGLID